MKKRNNSPIKKKIVIIHHNDQDGFGGAWAAWKKFKNRAEYIAADHDKDVPEGLIDKELYLIDFCYPEAIMRRLLETNKKVVVLDHHVSQQDIVGISTEHVYDVDRSGAVIAWQYFFPGEPVPKLLRHIEDMDLWQFNISNTKEIIAAMDEYPFDLKIWNKIIVDIEDKETAKKYLEAGRTILQYEKRVIERLLGRAEKVDFEGHLAYAVNAPILESEIGNWIVTHKKAIGIIWSYKGDGIKVSLRSDGKTDVSALAQRYGGGGHKAAAGFAFDVNMQFPWMRVEKDDGKKNNIRQLKTG